MPRLPPESTLLPYTTLFRSHVSRSLAAAEMQPSQLTLEVTESVLMNGIENAVSTLMSLRAMGVQLSIDDFGTGDRKSTRLNSSHRCSSYAVFCLKKKIKHEG